MSQKSSDKLTIVIPDDAATTGLPWIALPTTSVFNKI